MRVQFSDYPVKLEDLLTLEFEHANQWVLKQAWLEGTNMFMGKTSVFIRSSEANRDSVVHRAELFIGACSEPNMRWKLVIDLADIETGQSQLVSVFFQTQNQT